MEKSPTYEAALKCLEIKLPELLEQLELCDSVLGNCFRPSQDARELVDYGRRYIRAE